MKIYSIFHSVRGEKFYFWRSIVFDLGRVKKWVIFGNKIQFKIVETMVHMWVCVWCVCAVICLCIQLLNFNGSLLVWMDVRYEWTFPSLLHAVTPNWNAFPCTKRLVAAKILTERCNNHFAYVIRREEIQSSVYLLLSLSSVHSLSFDCHTCVCCVRADSRCIVSFCSFRLCLFPFPFASIAARHYTFLAHFLFSRIRGGLAHVCECVGDRDFFFMTSEHEPRV